MRTGLPGQASWAEVLVVGPSKAMQSVASARRGCGLPIRMLVSFVGHYSNYRNRKNRTRQPLARLTLHTAPGFVVKTRMAAPLQRG